VWVVSHPNSIKAKVADESSPGSQILASAPIAIGQSKLNTTSSFRMRFDQFDPCADRGAKHGRDGKEQGGAGKRRRMALYPQNPSNWGPQKSTVISRFMEHLAVRFILPPQFVYPELTWTVSNLTVCPLTADNVGS